jgi:protein-S-isoprenylcysteine O-methyltransferase Ste14
MGTRLAVLRRDGRSLGRGQLYLRRANPDVVAARVNRHEGTKSWDRIRLGFSFPTVAAIPTLAALDDGRFHWSPVPWWVCLLGYALLLTGIAGMTWAESVNKFFEPTVRIQSERGPTVSDTGPYSVVRHPGRVAGSLLFVGIALSLGSAWALVPVGLASLADPPDPLGRRDVAGRIGGLQGVHATGPLPMDSGHLVAPPMAESAIRDRAAGDPWVRPGRGFSAPRTAADSGPHPQCL